MVTELANRDEGARCKNQEDVGGSGTGWKIWDSEIGSNRDSRAGKEFVGAWDIRCDEVACAACVGNLIGSGSRWGVGIKCRSDVVV